MADSGLFPGFLDPQTQGLLSAGAGMLQAGGPQRFPVSTGQALGQGLDRGMQGYRASVGDQQMAQQLQQQELLRQMQMMRLAQQYQRDNSSDASLEAWVNSLPPEQRAAARVLPKEVLQGQQRMALQQAGGAPQFAPSSIGKLIQERNALPPDSPLRKIYDQAITNSSQAQERSPSFQFFPTPAGVGTGNRRTGEITPPAPGSPPMLAPAYDPALQGDLARKKAAGTKEGEVRTDAALNLPQTMATAEQALKVIDQMVGSEDGKVKPHPGFHDYVGFTYKPGMRYVEGSNAANFEALQKQLTGRAFLQAFESLKGGGQITEIEGRKATEAITRMSKSQSEDEYVKAAREFQDVIKTGVERAKQKAGGGATGAPSNQGWGIRPL